MRYDGRGIKQWLLKEDIFIWGRGGFKKKKKKEGRVTINTITNGHMNF